MDEKTLLRGYADLLKRLYAPKAYYRRCEAYLKRAGAIPKTRSSPGKDIGALLRTLWHIGVVSPRRRLFWRLLAVAMLRGAGRIRQAVAHAIQGEHLICYTREHVVPRIERTLAEIKAGIEHGSRPRRARGGTPRVGTASSPVGAGLPSALARGSDG
jgi:hypothetical protein